MVHTCIYVYYVYSLGITPTSENKTGFYVR